MSDEKNPTPEPSVNMSDFAALIGNAVSAGIAANTPKKVTFGQYMKRKNEGKSKLRRETYENGHRVDAGVLSNTEIDLFNKVDRTGRYLDRNVEVIVREEGTEEILEIRWPCRTADQRFEMKGLFRNMTDLLQQIIALQDEEDAERIKAGKPAPIPRHFGNSKASQEARARAEA